MYLDLAHTARHMLEMSFLLNKENGFIINFAFKQCFSYFFYKTVFFMSGRFVTRMKS